VPSGPTWFPNSSGALTRTDDAANQRITDALGTTEPESGPGGEEDGDTRGMTTGLFSRCLGCSYTFAAMTQFPEVFDGIRCLVGQRWA
jgi:hypothetical protein